ncbi:hypothetical protein AB0J86_07665 [Micromonospora sp. NPDC049559]|uniref:hypothetical protein n=1 Tax=Micromonospora sp. NPDC049559 TaxID=3155923 RepID=UPI0034195948
MTTFRGLPALLRNRFVWVAVVLLAVSTTAVVLLRTQDAAGRPEDLRGQLTTRLVALLEQLPPDQHQGHGHHAGASPGPAPTVVCGVRVFGFEPADATTVSAVDTVYAFHFCGVAEQGTPWDWAVKLVGPVVVGLTTNPPSVQVAQATETVSFRDRVQQLFPERYREDAVNESLGEEGMRDLRRRYEKAARV